MAGWEHIQYMVTLSRLVAMSGVMQVKVIIILQPQVYIFLNERLEHIGRCFDEGGGSTCTRWVTDTL